MRRAAWVVLWLTLPGCASTYRTTVAEPLVLSKDIALPQQQVWDGMVKTLVMEGEVIRTSQRPLGRVTLRKPLTFDSYPTLCETSATGMSNLRGLVFYDGRLDIVFWLPPTSAEVTILKSEGRCHVMFRSPTSRQVMASIVPLAIFSPFFQGDLQARGAWVPSSGSLERLLQKKIITALGVELPAWMHDQ